MPLLPALALRLRALFRRDSVERDLDSEIDLHIELETSAGERRGLSPEAARLAALLKFGGVDRYKEEARDARGLRALEELRQDTRLAFRLLRKNPGFTAAAVLTLALGIGANAAIFSVFDAVLLDASPFAAPDELVVVWETDRNSQTVHEPASWPDIVDFRDRSRTLEAIGALAGFESTLALPGADPERVAALGVTSNLFRLLGVRPIEGRLFAGDEGAFGGPQVALLAEDYWRARFGADPGVVGSTITLNELPTTVVGVVPADADLGIAQIHARADYSSPFSDAQVDLYIGFEPTADAYSRDTHPFLAVGRL
ncbi:MAG: ABC transporter permease, partial [Longimicrobiales bacterium]